MDVILAVFGSRTQAHGFTAAMRAKGIQCVIVPTPPALASGCGTASRFLSCDLTAAEKIIAMKRLRPVGIYVVKKRAARLEYRRIR